MQAQHGHGFLSGMLLGVVLSVLTGLVGSLTLLPGRATLQAGAGIVADSDPERERLETVNKAMAMDRALQRMAFAVEAVA